MSLSFGRGCRLPELLVLVGATAALINCGSPDRRTGSRALPPGTPVEVAAEPSLDVGEGAFEQNAAEVFHRVRSPFLTDDGRLAVPDGESRYIRVFDSAGSLDRSLGGPGERPGEFRRLDEAWHRGDTIEAWDWGLGRLTRFFPGDSVDIVGFEGGAGPRQVVPGTGFDGWIVTEISSAPKGGRRDEMVVRHVGPNGTDRGAVARTEGMSRFRTDFGGGPDPLSPRPLVDVANGQVFVAETLTPEIRVLSPSGDSLRTITWEPKSRPPPEDAARQTIDAIIARRSPEDTLALRKRLRSYPVREETSAFWSFLVDEEGFVWVQRYDPARHSLRLGDGDALSAGRGGEWIVFSPDGSRLTSVRMPDGLRPTEITSDAVVGVRRNEVGVIKVRIRPLERR